MTLDLLIQPMGTVKILLANMSPIFRQGVRSFLMGSKTWKIIGEATGKRQIFVSAQKLKPKLLVLNASESFSDVKEFFVSFRNSFSGIKILYFIDENEDQYCKKILKLGAEAYLSISDSKKDIIEAINQVSFNGTYVSENLKKSIIENCLHESKRQHNSMQLTEREKEILNLIANEFVTKEIANDLFISKHTVETHRKHLLSKINVRNTAGLVKYAVENDLA